MSWIGEFFTTVPDAMRALWEFGNAWRGVAVTAGSIVLIALFVGGALRLRNSLGWVSAVLGTMGAFIGAFWLFGILPSAWVFFADGERPLLEGTVLPGEVVVGELEVATNFYEVFRDSVVMAETAVAMAAMTFLAVWIQKRWPRQLAEGEEKPQATGGYR